MRVIGGTARGRRLRAPRGTQTRPTSDYLREVVFDLLAQQVFGRSFLDLYAGTGAVGIEALSRGASTAVFVEYDRSAREVLRQNLEALGFRDLAEVIPMKVLPFLRQAGRRSRRFDLIFLDPPYERSGAVAALSLDAAAGLLGPSGIVILEHSIKTQPIPLPHGLAWVREVRHGDSILQLYRQEAA
ncbi:MAG: 16S rRNA (guanine(966)-N(2))-methyltransferase RsmD [Candidatus Methylomirabilis oxyfera]|nr:16S rRNA (guanine(966)-N(2))-methyltransferase RsmD [Candidatus Methylomirabilis oxyfera]